MSGLLNSDKARSAAFFIVWAVAPALPLAVSGRMTAILTWPVPSAVPGGGTDAVDTGGGGGGFELLKRSVLIEQAPSSPGQAVASRPSTARRPTTARPALPGFRLTPTLLESGPIRPAEIFRP